MQRPHILKNSKSQSGFTLVELSIVLVIIGLIVSSVLVGQDLVKAATVRSLIAQRDTFDSAVFTFRGKYNILPGDGSSTAITACSGNGDGKLSAFNVAVTAATTANTGDSACFWMILGQGTNSAGYIPGAYTGDTASPGGAIAANMAIQPTSKLGGLWGAYYSEIFGSNAYLLGVRYGTTQRTQGADGSVDYTTALNIDTKIDDGLGKTGSIKSVLASDSTGGATEGSAQIYSAGTYSSLIIKMQSM
jgi:prepilin-type N-terminal cleavage/methylation domain-containing protein